MPPPTDIIFIDRLSLSAVIGPSDCWGKQSKPQPVSISVYLHLASLALTRVGLTDNVGHTINYGTLTKEVTKYVGSKSSTNTSTTTTPSPGFENVHEMVDGIASLAFRLGNECVSEGCVVEEVRVVVELPKLVQLAQGGVVFDEVVVQGLEKKRNKRTVLVKDLHFFVIIGVNEPERRDRQRVVVDLEFGLSGERRKEVDWKSLVRSMTEATTKMDSYLTLEKFVLEPCRAAFRTEGPLLETVTVRARKPSALSFADAAGVQMTRRKEDFE